MDLPDVEEAERVGFVEDLPGYVEEGGTCLHEID